MQRALGVAAITLFMQVSAALAGPGPDSAVAARARLLAHSVLLVDTHIDLPEVLLDKWQDVSHRTDSTDFDYPRAVAGGLRVPFMSIFVPSELEGTGKAKPRAEEMIGLVRKMASTWPDKFTVVTSTEEVLRQQGPEKILLAMGMENGSPIEGDLRNVEYFYRLGIRYITLAHAKWNHLGDGSYDTTRHWNGLSPFGVQVVHAMNRLGMMVDISHLTDSAAFQAIRASKAPVIASHSSCRAFTPGFERNISDELIAAVAARGGVVQINFGSEFISDSIRRSGAAGRAAIDKEVQLRKWDPAGKEAEVYATDYWKAHPHSLATVAGVASHIDHAVRLVGVDHVGLGSDFDGVGDTLPIGLKDVSHYPNLIAELLKLGYTESDIRKICGANLLRVWSAVERIAADLSAK